MDSSRVAHLACQYEVLVESDNEFQRRARVLQSIWRQEQSYPAGRRGRGAKERTLGSRLPMPWAEATLANYLSETVRTVVRSDVLDRHRRRGKLFARPRIFNDLLSSRRMCSGACRLGWHSTAWGVRTRNRQETALQQGVPAEARRGAV